jgi:VanZ family protein
VAALFWLALLAITALALWPKPPAAASLGWDKLNHVAAFAVLGLLARVAWPAQALQRWALLLAYGGLLELAQGLTPNRSAEWSDWLADALGLLLAVVLWAGWQRWQQLGRAVAKAD